MLFAGVDVGSRTTKAVILTGEGTILARAITDTGTRGESAADEVLSSCLKVGAVTREEITHIVSTGYGRRRVPHADYLSEITCHARGASLLVPGTRTVIDIGGQDSKVILLNESGGVVDFAMNDRCAAGTGRFLEVMARALEMDLFAMGGIRHDAANSATISSLCTVFAESEVISLLAEGCSVQRIVCGLQASVAERTQALLKRVSYSSPVTMTGGVAQNRGVVEALEERIHQVLVIPDEPQFVGAVGAAWGARIKSSMGR